MASGIKIQHFLGEAPKVSPELLPDTCAQIASNIKTYSGDLLPYNQSSAVTTVGIAGTPQAIFPLVKGDGSYTWLQWAADVDVVKSPLIDANNSQRFYYTGDNEPRVSNYALATVSGTLFDRGPQAYYTLGLPTPTATPTATAVAFSTISATQRSRDSGNTATITTGTAHNLNSGMYVTTTSFGGTNYNQSSVQVTSIDATHFSYYAYGAAETVTADTAGRIDIAGSSVSRSYVYTWLTAWGEESIPSPASNTVFVKEGQQVQVGGLPTAWPGGYTGTYQTTGMQMNIYRSVASTSGSNYFLAGTVYLSAGNTFRSRTSNVATITTNASHGYTVGSVVNVAGVGGTGYNASSVTITAVTANTFSYANTGSNETTTADTTGTVTISTWVDNVNVTTLTTILPSLYYDQPNAAMKGIVPLHNNMLAGFFGNTICFCEPGVPHAWPVKYRITVPDAVVAVANVGAYIIVLTDANPWVIQGNNPSVMTKIRMDYTLPCVSKRSVVNMGYGLTFASRGGVAIYALAAGGSQLTQHVYDWDNFRTSVDPTTILAKFYNGKYFAVHSQGGFIFEKDEKVGGFLVENNQGMIAGYYDKNAAKLYYTYNSNVWLWDDKAQPFMTFDWKSKVIVTKDYINLGAGRVIADYGTNANDILIAAQNVITLAANQSYVAAGTTAGALASRGPTTGATWPRIGGTLGQVTFGGSRVQALTPIGTGVTFQLYVNKTLLFTTQMASNAIFRMPTGYRADTFEVRVSGNTRVRAVHLGETPLSLKQV